MVGFCLAIVARIIGVVFTAMLLFIICLALSDIMAAIYLTAAMLIIGTMFPAF